MDVSRRDMQAVVFIEEHDDVREPDEPAADPEPPQVSLAARWSRPVRQWWPVAAGLVLVVVATAAMVSGRREDARLAALAEVPGMLTMVEGPVAELWRADGGRFLGLVEFAGTLVGAQQRSDGGVDVVALDPQTGRDVWRTPARGPGATKYGTQCALPVPPLPTQVATSPRTVACLVVDKTETTPENALGSSTYPTAARLVMLDATTGAVRSDSPVDPSTTLAEFGTDLVRSRIGADGRLRVERTDGLGLHTRWTFTSPEPVGVDIFEQPFGGAYSVGSSIVAIAASNRAAPDDQPSSGVNLTWVLDADGKVSEATVPVLSTGQDGWIQPLRDGELLAVPEASTGGADTTRIVDLKTGRSFTAQAYPASLTPDDGSLDQLLLMQGQENQTLQAYELTTGRLAWSRSGTNAGGTLIIDGRIISASSSGLQSIDGRSGEVVWATPISSGWASLMTDGHVVLIGQSRGADSSTLTAYGLDDGRERWTTELSTTYSLGAVGGRLFGWTEVGVIAFG